jgi:hypothetical protein
MSTRVYKKVISHDTGNALLCCWDDCERYGYENHMVKINEGYEPIYRPDLEQTVYTPKIVKFVFCSNNHRQMFIDENPTIKGDSSTAGLHGRLRSGNRSGSRYV